LDDLGLDNHTSRLKESWSLRPSCIFASFSASVRKRPPLASILSRIIPAIIKNNQISYGSLGTLEDKMPKISPELMYLIFAALAFVLINR
jgi:hypothetical protein